MARRSGSEKRQLTELLILRVTPEQKAMIRQNARTLGQSMSATLREGRPLQKRRAQIPRIDLEAVARVRTGLGALVGAVNKVGSNFNQFAREVNRGREPRADSFVAEWDEFKAMFDRDMAELRIVCLQALGKEPQRITARNDED